MFHPVTPTTVNGFSDRLTETLHATGGPFTNTDPETLTSAVLAFLEDEMGTAWEDWADRGSRLRTCVFPGCLRQFDLVGSWTAEGRKSVEPHLSSDGWLQSKVIGFMCPDHAPALWGEGDGPHNPNWRRDESRRSGAVLRCSCGWEAGDTRFRGHGEVLWKVHVLDILEPQQ